MVLKYASLPGEYTEFDRGSRFFFSNGNLHVSKQYPAHSHMRVKLCAHALARGFGNMPPKKI